jgi:hypothetical protein
MDHVQGGEESTWGLFRFTKLALGAMAYSLHLASSEDEDQSTMIFPLHRHLYQILVL